MTDSLSEQHQQRSGNLVLPVGTRIVFLKSLYGDVDEFSPGCIYAKKGDGGVITGHGTPEGYWVKWDKWPHAFGAEHGVDFIAAVPS